MSALGITKLPSLGGLGSIVSAASSLFGGSKGASWKDKWSAFKNDQKMQEKAFQQKMDLAKKHKIHPLTMLGAQVPQVSSPVYSGGSGSNMGQNIGNLISQGASQLYTGSIQSQMNDLALERAQLENDLLRSQISSINDPVRTAGSLKDARKSFPTKNGLGQKT